MSPDVRGLHIGRHDFSGIGLFSSDTSNQCAFRTTVCTGIQNQIIWGIKDRLNIGRIYNLNCSNLILRHIAVHIRKSNDIVVFQLIEIGKMTSIIMTGNYEIICFRRSELSARRCFQIGIITLRKNWK